VIENYPFPWRFDAAQYSEFYLMRQITESQVQSDILALFAAFKVDCVAIDAGGRRQRGRMIAAAKSAGVALAANLKLGGEIPAGYADLEATLAPGGRSVYIEVKAPAWMDENKKLLRGAGRPSDEQLAFLLSKHNRGAVVMVAWAAQDVDVYLGPQLLANRKAVR
jgi:hypothetical protein